MFLIVYGQAQFELSNAASHQNMVDFLSNIGFIEIGDWHIDHDYSICTAEYYGKKKSFPMPTIDIPEFYHVRIALKDKNFLERTSYNANMLNELCRRNGRER